MNSMYAYESKKKNKQSVTQANNYTGIPTQMKKQFETRSGVSFDDVKVHYNSKKPAQLRSLAYTQGNQVYLGQGQEKHLGHELVHVVQQKQGRVSGNYINQDHALESEADQMRIPYMSIEKKLSPIIQAKSMRKLLKEFEALGIEKSDSNNELISLASQFDSLENTDMTKSDQTKLLQRMYEILESRTEDKYKQALKLVNTEMSFVVQQNISVPIERPLLWDKLKHEKETSHIEGLIKQYDDVSVKNMNYAKQLLEKARDYSVGSITMPDKIKNIIDDEIAAIDKLPAYTTDTKKSLEPYKSLDSAIYWKVIQKFYTDLDKKLGKETVKALSEKHVASLETFVDDTLKPVTGNTKLRETYNEIKKKVIEIIEKDGILAHYSHLDSLTSLESNDQLRESGMLQKPIEDLENVDINTIGADKSQDFDKKGIGNTGFVFCFIERDGSNKRNSRFGENRYIFPMNKDSSILKDGWAITYDLVDSEVNSHPYTFSTDKSSVDISRDVMTEDPKEKLESPYKDKLSLDHDWNEETSLLSLQNVLKRKTVFKADINEASFLEKEHADNFLYGNQIIEGIATRTAAELIFSHIKLGAEIDKFKTDEDALWGYVQQVVFKTQIMIPYKIIPDFIQKKDGKKEEVKPNLEVYNRSFNVDDTKDIPASLKGGTLCDTTMTGNVTINPMKEKSVGNNNNFFECVKETIGYSKNAEELKEEFEEKDGVGKIGNEPVDLDHIKLFSKHYNIKIRVIIYAQGEEAFSVLYDERADKSLNKDKCCQVVLMLPKLRSEGDNPVGRFLKDIK